MSGIYIASKTKHGPRWIELRKQGVPIISSWIDEYAPGATSNFADLWTRCIQEASECDVLILYIEDGEELKGALAEVGAALAHGKPVILTGYSAAFGKYSLFHHPNVTCSSSLDHAVELAQALMYEMVKRYSQAARRRTTAW